MARKVYSLLKRAGESSFSRCRSIFFLQNIFLILLITLTNSSHAFRSNIGFWRAIESSAEVVLLDSNSVVGSTVTVPAGVQSGDLIVISDWVRHSSTPTEVIPSGFTVLHNSGLLNSRRRLILSYKIAAGTEGGTLITGMSGNEGNYKVLMVFRANFTPSGISPGTPAFTTTDGNPTEQVIGAAGEPTPGIVFAVYASFDGASVVDPRTFTGATMDAELSANVRHYLKYKIFNGGSTPADVTIDMDDEGSSNTLQGIYITLQ